jgi:hypothetical protein
MTNHTFKAGNSRRQASLLPARVEDYVGPDNPVRAIESFVCALDLGKLGFRHADRGAEAMGQPPYDPADLLKLYLYGYINQVRSAVAILYAGFMHDACDQKARGVSEKVPFASFDLSATSSLSLLPASNPRGPPASVVLIDWLSITPAVGLASRPSASRAIMTRWWLIFCQVPSSRHR